MIGAFLCFLLAIANAYCFAELGCHAINLLAMIWCIACGVFCAAVDA